MQDFVTTKSFAAANTLYDRTTNQIIETTKELNENLKDGVAAVRVQIRDVRGEIRNARGEIAELRKHMDGPTEWMISLVNSDFAC